MKKIFALVLLFFVLANYTIAQPPGRGFDPSAMKDRQKTQLIQDLKLTDAQADSVATIQMEFMPKLRGLRGLQAEERMAKMKEMNDAFKARLTKALNNNTELVKKVMAYREEKLKERMERRRGDE